MFLELIRNTELAILVPRGRTIFGQHQESRPLAGSDTGSLRFMDFPSLCACSGPNLTNLFAKPIRTRIPLDLSRGHDSWCWSNGARPLGTRMRTSTSCWCSDGMSKENFHSMINVNKLFSFSSRYFLKEVENMFSVFLLSHRNTRESLGELEKAMETIACWLMSHVSISHSTKLPLMFLLINN